MAVFAMGAAGLVIGLSLMALFVVEDLGRASLVFPTLMGALGGGTDVPLSAVRHPMLDLEASEVQEAGAF